MPLSRPSRWLNVLKRRDRDRFQRFNIVVAILLAGWVPSVLMLVVSYRILTTTLESKILRDRQTFVQLIAHLVGDDFSRTTGIIEYYQAQPEVAQLLTGPNPEAAAQQWLTSNFYSHPRLDGMFVAAPDGRLIASIPPVPPEMAHEFAGAFRGSEPAAEGVRVSPVHRRVSDKRLTTDIVGAVRSPDGAVVGYVGVSVLVERMGRRLSTVEFADQSVCQVIDQNGFGLFARNFQPNKGESPPQVRDLMQEMLALRSGHIGRFDNLYSFSPIDNTGWVAVVEQPKSVAYQPVQDLLRRITFPAVWLIILTGVGAWLAGRYSRRQTESARRLEREVIFNEKILANMPTGIALVDPGSRNFLQANDAFTRMAREFGSLSRDRDIYDATYDEVKIAASDAIERVLAFGAPFQLVEQQFTDRNGNSRFVNVNLLRLQGADLRVQGVLYLVEDKTHDVTLRQELIDANAAKDQFLALLSHELRNPLSPVIMMVSELEAAAVDSPDVRHALEVIRRNVELEARLIDDLLDVTRIAKQKLQLSFEIVNVHEVLQRAYEICREDILSKDLAVEFRLRAEVVHVQGDPARLQQVFWNLIKNSVKFTPERGRIIVETFNPMPDRIEIKITDTGIGIEPQKIDRIFNAFEQGQSSITRRFGGLGLGLAISKAMVDAHHGTIAVASEGRDRGATFTVTLHTTSAPARLEAAPRTRAGGEVEVGASNGNGNGKQSGAGHKRRLLVVDDHQDTCLGMKMILERRGYHVTLAHSATEAVARAAAEQFDLVISDIGLPDRSGYELMQELRAQNSLRGIAVSGYGMENDIMRARAAGFSQHLTKPINIEKLDAAIQQLLGAEAGTRNA
jgi:signal transduction histidine kinase/CheY-like chemotaxis protein